MARVTVIQVRSVIGCPQDQRRTVRSLGLHRIGHSVQHEDTPSVRGMIFKVRHLVEVKEGNDSGARSAKEAGIEETSA